MVRHLSEGANIFRDPQGRFFITKFDISEARQIEMCLRFTKKRWQFKSYIFNKITWQQIKFSFCWLRQKIGYFFSFLGHSTLGRVHVPILNKVLF